MLSTALLLIIECACKAHTICYPPRLSSVPERAHSLKPLGLILIIRLPFLPCFFRFASPPRVFVAHTQNGYQNDRLGRESMAKTFLRVSANGFAKNPEKRSQKMNGCVLRELSRATVSDVIARVERGENDQ